MDKKCKARITKEYKRAKAVSVWPETVYGPVPEHLAFPECGGDVRYTVRVSQGCNCGYGDGSDLEIEAICSRCRAPFVDGVLKFTMNAEDWLREKLNE